MAVYGRVKNFESFYEKIDRKEYEEPFQQTEDLVGVRVILYFPQDIEKVITIIKSQFDVEQFEDKSDRLKTNEFGYRSHHCIVRIKKAWCITPNYSGLEKLKAEIQVRTVLMHAWAEVEHKLQYKNKEQVPKELQRKLFLLSAKFEEADVQFEEIRNGVDKYTAELNERLRNTGGFPNDLELNLDSFKQFLKFYYPNNDPHDNMAVEEFELVTEHQFKFKDLSEIVVAFQPLEGFLREKVSHLTQPAVFSYALDILKPYVKKGFSASDSRKKVIKELNDRFETIKQTK